MSDPAIPFGERLDAVFAAYGHLCLGLDPHASVLAAWGQADSAEGVRELGLRAIEAAAGRVGIVKPQIAFFERHGAAGYVWLAVAAVLLSLVGAFYYLRVVKLMYFDDPPEGVAEFEPRRGMRGLLSANGLALLFFGILPQPLMAACFAAVAGL